MVRGLCLGDIERYRFTWAIVVIDSLRISLDIEEEGLGTAVSNAVCEDIASRSYTNAQMGYYNTRIECTTLAIEY